MDQKLLTLDAYLVEKIWGGKLLAELKNAKPKQDSFGESWEISTLKDGSSMTKGISLRELEAKHKVQFGNKELPYLVKLIDTSDHLSVQVHPADEYAAKYENSLGKSECWIILDSRPGDGIFLGLNKDVTKTQLEKVIRKGEDLRPLLKFYPVKKGDFFFVPAGTIHAIGAGVLLAEVQQASGITYRVWDWNRVDKDGVGRELHIDHALNVIRFENDFNSAENFRIQAGVFDYSEVKLATHECFEASSLSFEKGESKTYSYSDRPASFLVIDGEVEISLANEKIKLGKYQAAMAILDQSGNGGEFVLESSHGSKVIMVR